MRLVGFKRHANTVVVGPVAQRCPAPVQVPRRCPLATPTMIADAAAAVELPFLSNNRIRIESIEPIGSHPFVWGKLIALPDVARLIGSMGRSVSRPRSTHDHSKWPAGMLWQT